jgi:hypothetical protein
LELIAKNLGAFITLALAVGGLIWHLITQWFDYKNHKLDIARDREAYAKKFDGHDKRIKENDNTLTEIKALVTEFIAGADGRDARLKAEIIAIAAEQDKQILMKVLDQETRNSKEYGTMAKVFGEVKEQLSIMNINISSQGKSIDNMTMKIEGIEREKLEDLKEKLAGYIKNHM